MEYTIYLYDETNKLPEVCESGDNAYRINAKYIDWYEGMIETNDMLKELGFKEEELDEKEY